MGHHTGYAKYLERPNFCAAAAWPDAVAGGTFAVSGRISWPDAAGSTHSLASL